MCVGQLHQIRGGEGGGRGGEGREERGGEEKREGRGGEVLEVEPDRPRWSHITCLTSVPCIVILCTGMCTAIDTITNWASDVCSTHRAPRAGEDHFMHGALRRPC